MCGIAGYNVTPEIAESLGKKTIRKILSAGIRNNLHRGMDATGWFASYPNEEGIIYSKAAMSGDKFLAYPEAYPHPTPNVLGIHTRAASKAYDPSNNANNHPVIAYDMLVTHNGIIRTSDMYRYSELKIKEERESLPPVDSACIPIHFRHITDPRAQFDDLTALVYELNVFNTSGYTFHLTWANHPGLSLIVRGPEYPLHYIHDEAKGLHIYASQCKAAYEMSQKFNRSGYNLTESNLKSGNAVIIDNGHVEWWDSFKTTKTTVYSGFNHNTPSKVRIRNHVDGTEAYRTPAGYHFSSEDKPLSHLEALLYEDQGMGEVVALIEEGIVSVEATDYWDKEVNKRSHSGSRVPAKLWEAATDADYVYVWIPKPWISTRIVYYFMYGEVENVFDSSMSYLDTYNWDRIDPEIDWRLYPWIDHVEPEIPVPDEEETFAEWFSRVSTDKEIDCTKYAPEDAKVQKNSGKFVQLKNGIVVGEDTPQLPLRSVGSEDNPIYFCDIPIEELEKLHSRRFSCNWYDSNLVVVEYLKCKEHSRLLEKHGNPWGCYELVHHAYKVLGSATSMERYKDVYGTYDISYVAGSMMSGHKHDMQVVRWNMFKIAGEDMLSVGRAQCMVEGCNFTEIVDNPLLDPTTLAEENVEAWISLEEPV